jgi:hypothetical protein
MGEAPSTISVGQTRLSSGCCRAIGMCCYSSGIGKSTLAAALTHACKTAGAIPCISAPIRDRVHSACRGAVCLGEWEERTRALIDLETRCTLDTRRFRNWNRDGVHGFIF